GFAGEARGKSRAGVPVLRSISWAGALIIILTKTNPASISKNEVFRSGMIAIVAVYGIAWMAETMFGAHMSEIQGVLGEMVKEYPWAYAIVLLLVSKFVNSQA
ncbi:anaerobic C4-dicarboxylate transporter family protein, partial [Pseudomonas aeruginosa]|uniref:anaerobic C4-dicarboxylate transporter family protein n=1 Tax=Pseudomonas aeruginosa TaxID=287 RepID=UPI0031B70D5E